MAAGVGLAQALGIYEINCPQYGGSLSSTTKRQSAKGATPFLFELIGVLIMVFSYGTEYVVIGFLVGFLALILGHNAAYEKIRIRKCHSRKSEYP